MDIEKAKMIKDYASRFIFSVISISSGVLTIYEGKYRRNKIMEAIGGAVVGSGLLMLIAHALQLYYDLKSGRLKK